MKAKILTYSGWTIVWILAFFFVVNNAARYFNLESPVYTPEFKPFAPFIMIHVAGGVVALIIGPVQFFDAVRRKYTSLHRTIGKIYLISVLLSAISSVYLAIFDNLLLKNEFIFATGALSMALAWFITAGMAYWAVVNRSFNQHKEWMIRSYVLTSNFIIFRLIFYGLLSIEDLPNKNLVGDFTVWVGWSVPLLITETVIQFKKIKRVRSH